MAEKKKIMLVEDHPIFRLGLAELINQEEELVACGTSTDVDQAIRLQVFKMVGKGFTSKEIAIKLFLSIKTIGTYKKRIKEKLGLKNGNELVRCAVHFEKTGEIESVN